MLKLAAFFYLGIAVLAIGLNALRGAPLIPLAMTARLYPALAASGLMTLATLVFCSFGARRWAWVQELETSFRRILGPLEARDVLILAFASGASEEIFFRGAIQPALIRATGSEILGLLLATAAFTVLHAPLERGLRLWPAFAFVLGLFLGAVTLACENVIPAAACHIAVNAVNLRRITRPVARP